MFRRRQEAFGSESTWIFAVISGQLELEQQLGEMF